MNTTDRVWATITGVVLLVSGISWFWKGDRPPVLHIITSIQCNSTHSGDCFNLSNQVQGYWEATGAQEYTVVAEIAATKTRPVNCYVVGTGPHGQDSTGRMPAEWVLWGSSDGKQWKLIDEIKEQKDWRVDERRYFPLQKKSDVRYFKLNIQSDKPSNIVRLYGIGFLENCP